MPSSIELIISGGQTGADRAGLNFARAAKINHNGWCPLGRKAEDGPIPAIYNLRESSSPDYPPRTRQNVKWGDATVVFTTRRMGPGSALAIRLCAQELKECLILYTDQPIHENAKALAKWLREIQPRILNVAGNRESSDPGVGDYVEHVLWQAWSATRI